MHIGIDVQPLQTGTRQAGVGRYLSNLLQNIARLDTENTYTLFLNNADFLHPVTAPARTWKFHDVPRKYRLGRFWWWWDSVYLPVACMRHKIDIFHYNSLSEAEPMAPPPPLKPYRLVTTIHDLVPLRYPEMYPECFSQSWKDYAFSDKLRRLQKADAIITVSEFSKREIVALLGYPEDRIFVAHNGVAPAYFHQPDEALLTRVRACYSLPEEFILYLGGYYSPRKNVPRLLEAYAQLSQYNTFSCLPLILAGVGAESHQKQLQALLRTMQLTHRVRCLPYIPERELPALFHLASLFVYPSFYEGFGLPVAEAMACGTIVATSNTSSLPEIGGEACLYFDPHNMQSIAETLYKGLTNPGLRESLRQKGRQQASKFSWEDGAQTVLSVYKKVLEQ